MVAVVEGSPGVEVCMVGMIGRVGREGMLGDHVALGIATAPLHALAQGVGNARCIDAVAVRKELAQGIAMQQGVNDICMYYCHSWQHLLHVHAFV